MHALVLILRRTYELSVAYPRLIVIIFVVLGTAGFASMPFIRISPTLTSTPSPVFPTIGHLSDQIELFGEEEVLTVAIEFPEDPGEWAVPIVTALTESLRRIPDVQRARCRFLDPGDRQATDRFRRDFLLSMDEAGRARVRRMLGADGLRDSFRRNMNRLWLAYDEDFQKKILEDPFELDRYMLEVMSARMGSHFLQDERSLFASPDGKTYLIHLSPEFADVDVVRSSGLLARVRALVSETLPALVSMSPGVRETRKADVQWRLTGKLVFTNESYGLFLEGIARIFALSIILCLGFLFAVYRSFWAAVILFAPIAAGVGPNYGLIFLGHHEINPLVMSSTSVLFGLGTDYGVHLWGRFSDEIDKGVSPIKAGAAVYERTGPAIVVGALTNILAFLCLCLSEDAGMFQFGYVGATGLCLTLIATLLLFPAIVVLLSRRRKKLYPRMRLRLGGFPLLFKKGPRLALGISALLIAVCMVGASRVSYQKDLLKAFYAQGMESTAVAQAICRKFQVDFSMPVMLFFDVEDLERGLVVQRQLDSVLLDLMQREEGIASLDSVSYRMAPDAVRTTSVRFFAELLRGWPGVEKTFEELLGGSPLSEAARAMTRRSFQATATLVDGLASASAGSDPANPDDHEYKRYLARWKNGYRLVTRIIYSSQFSTLDQLNEVDRKIREAIQGLPVPVILCGPRQAMEELIANSVREVFRLGFYVVAAVVLFFLALFRHPVRVVLSLFPMLGAFCVVVGVMGVLGMGVPMAMVAVAPLIFGLSMDNGVHVVMGSLQGPRPSVATAIQHVARPIVCTSVTNVLGFVAMLTSRHYGLEFLGWAMLIGMTSSVILSLTTLPAVLLLMERRQRPGKA